MKGFPGDLGTKINELIQQVGKDGPGKTSGFDIPGESSGVDVKDAGKGDAGKLGSSFDGPWDRQDKLTEASKPELSGSEAEMSVTGSQGEAGKNTEHIETEVKKDLDTVAKNYNDEVKQASAGGKYEEVEAEKLKKCSPEEIAKERSKFNKIRNELIKNWEDINQRKWPTYDKDVVTAEGKTIRKAGDRYDAHHVQPLELGGKNTSENITPMHAKDHFDKQGIHRPGGSYDHMVKAFKEV